MSFSVIIPSKNAGNLNACVRAIREAGETCQIIIVDDGILLDDIEDDWFCSHADVETGVKPFVFSRNINIGIRAAGDDDVILLNDDALLQNYAGFSAISWQATGFGILAPACTNVGNVNQMPHGCREVIREEPRTLCFTCVYIPRRTIDRVGLMDEQFVDYGMDDDDYCLRVRNAGLKLGIWDGCVIDHHHLQSSYRGAGSTGGDFTVNMRRFIAKWGVDNWGQPRDTSKFAHLFPEAK